MIDNSHAETKKLRQSVFMQVCANPFEASSPEGD